MYLGQKDVRNMKYVRISLIILAAILLSVVLFVSTAFVFGFEEILPFVDSSSSDAETTPGSSTSTQTSESEPTESDESEPTESEATEPKNTESDPTESSDPADPTEPADTTDPTDSTDPTDPTEPTDPTDPTEPTEPTVPTDPTNPTDPTDSKPTEPKPTEPKPTEPKPTEPKPTEPKPTEPKPSETQNPNLEEEGSALEDILKPAQITILHPTAPGILTESNSSAIIDYSNKEDGYVMAKFLKDPGVRLKVQVVGPATTYTYNVNPKEWTVFPLSDGNGKYTIKLFKNVVDNKYSTVLSASFTVTLENEFAPFLRPNQYVNYENEPLTAEAASKVTHDGATMLEKVKAVYNYVVTNISYDYQKAASVQSGYLPDLDSILKSRKGICFDYAALMTGMLRSLNVPCKLVVGYAGTQYHAWISVWSEETGWIDGAIYFNGADWQQMDPTFAASGSADLINKVTYTSKYIY